MSSFVRRFAIAVAAIGFIVVAGGCELQPGADDAPPRPGRNGGGDDVECGDGDVNGDEECDGDDIDGTTCEGDGFGPGVVTCSNRCTLDRSGCGAAESCGDGVIDGSDVCDGADVGTATCHSLGFGEGVLGCAGNCAAFDTSACPPKDNCVPECGAAVCGVDPVCGTSCGTCDDGSSCDDGVCVDDGVCSTTLDICDGDDCAVTFDVPVFAVATRLLIDGAAFLDPFVSSEGGVRFTDTTTGVTFRFNPDIPSSENVFRLPAGVYDVDIFVNDDRGAQGLAEDTPLRARSAFVVSADTRVTFDVPVFDVATRLLVDGAAFLDPFVSSEGGVRFTDTTTGVTFRFNPDIPSSENVFRLPAGVYDVDIFVNDDRGAPGLAEDTPLRARSGFVVSADTRVTFDVPVFDVATRLLIDGTAFLDPFESSEGGVRFTDTTTGVTFRFNPDIASAENVFRLPGGRYDVDIFVNDDRGIPGLAEDTPLRARSGFVVSADTRATFDVPVFDVATRLLVDGTAFLDPFESSEGGVRSPLPSR